MNPAYSFSREEALEVFSDKQSTLQEMASFKFAISLWSGVLANGEYHNVKGTLKEALGSTFPVVIKMIKNLHVPRTVKERLKACCSSSLFDLNLWMVYNYANLMPFRRITLFACHFKCCVWKSHVGHSGRIDYRASALKMISLGYFDKRSTFEILCKFCVEDKLRAIPLDAEFRKYTSELTFEKQPLSYYWVCYLTGEMRKIPWRKFGKSSVIIGMLTQVSKVDNWHSIEYFFNRLAEDDRVAATVALVTNQANLSWFLKQLFWKLDECDWRAVFMLIPIDVINVFFRQYDEPKLGLIVWMRVKHLLIGEMFADLMQRVLKVNEKRASTFDVAMELWNTAEDTQKSYLMTHETELVVEKFFASDFILNYDEKLEFLFDLLKFAPDRTRENLILESGDRLLVVDDFTQMFKIIELCLPRADDAVEFKKFAVKSEIVRKNCVELFNRGRFAHLDKFFEAFSIDEANKARVKQWLLERKKKLYVAFIFDPERWSEFENFIDPVGTGLFYSTSIKKQFVLAFRLIAFDDWKNTQQLEQLKNLAAQFLTKNESIRLRKVVLGSLKVSLINLLETFTTAKQKYFEADFLTELVRWCAGNDARVSQFKRGLGIDEIFVKTIRTLTSYIRYDIIDALIQLEESLFTRDSINTQVFLALDELFKWYLGTAEKAKQYKLKKIFNFKDRELFQDLESTVKVDEQDARTMLVWFLGNDDEEIRKFKSKCPNEMITNAI